MSKPHQKRSIYRIFRMAVEIENWIPELERDHGIGVRHHMALAV